MSLWSTPRPRKTRGPAGRAGEWRESRVLIILPRSGPTPLHDPGGRLRPSGPERPDGPVERCRPGISPRGAGRRPAFLVLRTVPTGHGLRANVCRGPCGVPRKLDEVPARVESVRGRTESVPKRVESVRERSESVRERSESVTKRADAVPKRVNEVPFRVRKARGRDGGSRASGVFRSMAGVRRCSAVTRARW
jgi:hypothetical protein